MKIINIVPGFGGTFYCGNCLRDSGMTEALSSLGIEAHTLPIYLPLFSEKNQTLPDTPVFYGAVNIYLKQNFKIFRKMPGWMYQFFNSPFFLKYAASKAGSTRTHGLEEMTISMLRGHEGYQQHELQMLIDYLRFHEKPDIVHLSNALLLGLANKIKTELKIPVVCSLQDEDVWVDAMHGDYRKKVWDLMSKKGEDVDAFIAVSDFFANVMAEKMDIPAKKLHTIYVGIASSNYTYHQPETNKPIIGYLSRMNKENGFETLCNAFIILKKHSGFSHIQLRVSGGFTDDDRKFIKKQIKKFDAANILKDVEFVEDYSKAKLNDFFNGLSLLSVPVLKGEAFGLYQLEALASGIPLVQPALGAFPEIIMQSGGGQIYQPNTPEKLAEKWIELLSNTKQLITLSKNGHQAVMEKFDQKVQTKKIVEVYRQIALTKNRT
jgi:glycosyltransferase involved in cell wall biosynthesis